MNNIAAQFEDLYSRRSLLDKAGKDAQLAEMMKHLAKMAIKR